jgi:hypothetical protein
MNELSLRVENPAEGGGVHIERSKIRRMNDEAIS